VEQKSLGKQHNHNQISRFHLCTFALSQGYSMYVVYTFGVFASLFSKSCQFPPRILFSS